MKKIILSSLLILLSTLAVSDAGELDVKFEAQKGCENSVKLSAPKTHPAKDAIKILPPKEGIYPGLYNIETTKQAYYDFTKLTGKPPSLVYTFHDFLSPKDLYSDTPRVRTFTEPLEGDGAPSPLALAAEISKHNSILAFSWAIECCDFNSKALWYNLQKPNKIVPRILKGDFDKDIKVAAKQIKEFKKPLMLSIFAEFHQQARFLFGKDGRTEMTRTDNICSHYGDPKWPDGPERVRDTITHIIDIFRQEGVKNVTWFMYTSTRYMDPTYNEYTKWMHPKFFYPGDAYIDWVGQSAFFIDPDNRPKVNSDYHDIVTAIKPGYDAWGEVTQRPFFLPEFSAPTDGKFSRAKILRKVLKDYLPSLPRVKALTLTNGKLFRDYYEVPLLGKFPDEITTWKEVVTNNPYYKDIQLMPPKQISP